MAEIASLFLVFLSLFSPVISRNISPKLTTTLLDVSASLSRTTQVLSHSYQQEEEEEEEESAKSVAEAGANLSLHLQLHSGDFLPYSRSTVPADYRALTLSRLARDSSRVAAIAARVASAMNGIKNSDLTPQQQQQYATESIQGPVTSGSSQGSGEYFSRVGIGSPARPLYLVLDTGSDVSWAQCQPCADCYQQSDPVFDPSASSTYSPLGCDSAPCKSLDVSSCRNATCLYQVSYGDGSYTVGDFATETFTLGSSRPLRDVAFGCGHDNEGLFAGAAGLLGLGGGALSLPSQISAKSFSYCLVDRDSSSASTLDFADADGSPPALSSGAVSTSLLRNSKVDTFYYIGMSGIAVGGRLLSIPRSAFDMDASGAGGVIVDSGTAVTRLQTEAYAALRGAFVSGTRGLPRAARVALFDTCYDLSSRTSVDVPTVGLRFGEGKELRLPAKNYLIPVDSAGTFCLAFAPTSSRLSIIGNVQQQGTRVTFDLQNAMVGFESGKC